MLYRVSFDSMVNVPECLRLLFLRFRKVEVQQIVVAFGLPIPSASTASFSRRERGVRFLMKDAPIVAQPSSTGFGKTMRTTSGTGSAAFIISSCLSTNSTTPFQFLVCFKGLYRHSKFFQWYVPHGFDLEFSSKSAIRLKARKIRKTKNVKCLFPAIETGFDALPA